MAGDPVVPARSADRTQTDPRAAGNRMTTPAEGAMASAGLPVDPDRWPAMVPPATASFRARIAKSLLTRAVEHTGVRVSFPDGSSLGHDDLPTLRVLDSERFLTRLGRDGLIGFGESYMA